MQIPFLSFLAFASFESWWPHNHAYVQFMNRIKRSKEVFTFKNISLNLITQSFELFQLITPTPICCYSCRSKLMCWIIKKVWNLSFFLCARAPIYIAILLFLGLRSFIYIYIYSMLKSKFFIYFLLCMYTFWVRLLSSHDIRLVAFMIHAWKWTRVIIVVSSVHWRYLRVPLHDIYYSERLFEREKKKKRGCSDWVLCHA